MNDLFLSFKNNSLKTVVADSLRQENINNLEDPFKNSFPIPPYLIYITIIIIALIALYLYYRKNKIKFVLKNNKLAIGYHFLFYAYKNRNKDHSPGYFLKFFFKNKKNYPEEDFDYIFWEEIFEYHPKNLIACLERNKIYNEDVNYFEQLRQNRFENSLTYKYNEKLFGEIVGQAKLWALYRNKQQAARLLALAIKCKLINPKKKTQIVMQDHCNKLLGLRENEKFNLKSLFEFPFVLDTLKLTPRSVFNSCFELLKYLDDKKEELDLAYKMVKKELNEKKYEEFRNNKPEISYFL